MNAIVDEAQKDLSRQLVDVWEKGARESGAVGGVKAEIGDATVRLMPADEARAAAVTDEFLTRALKAFAGADGQQEVSEWHEARWASIAGVREYRYAKAARDLDKGGALTGVVVLTR